MRKFDWMKRAILTFALLFLVGIFLVDSSSAACTGWVSPTYSPADNYDAACCTALSNNYPDDVSYSSGTCKLCGDYTCAGYLNDAAECYTGGTNPVGFLNFINNWCTSGGSGTTTPFCGDGVITSPEVCDNAASSPSRTKSCTTINGYLGSQTCVSDCTGYGACTTTQFCGDTIKNGPEVCDFSASSPTLIKSCTTANNYLGTQICLSGCNGYAPCLSAQFCGDSAKNGAEVCDPGASSSSRTQACTISGNPGTQACLATCNGYGTCNPNQYCGDGIKNGIEDCDLSDLNGKTCTTLGYDGGTLRCTVGCNYDTSACISAGGIISNIFTKTFGPLKIYGPYCGNSITDAGEECDDGNLNDFDSCDTTCHLRNCTIDSIDVKPGSGCNLVQQSCTMGKNLSVTVSYSGSSCNLADTIQVDLSDQYGACVIQKFGGLMTGTHSTMNPPYGNPLVYSYTIPDIPDECAGQRLTNFVAAMYSNVTQVRTKFDYVGTNMSAAVTLDRCSEFGTVQPYSIFGQPADYFIINSGSCYQYTCVNYDPTSAFVNNVPGSFGVYLFNDSVPGYQLHACGVADNVCPNDFSNGGLCGNVSGICAINNISDTDCKKHIFMNCSYALVNGSIHVPACTPTFPTPHKQCSSGTDCVYANESTGLNPRCWPNNRTILSSTGESITCNGMDRTNTFITNVWCPEYYGYDVLLGRCIKLTAGCDLTCPYAVNLSNTLNSLITSNGNLYNASHQPTDWYYFVNTYLNNASCISKNPATGKYNSYCTLLTAWPEPYYARIPINITTPEHCYGPTC